MKKKGLVLLMTASLIINGMAVFALADDGEAPQGQTELLAGFLDGEEIYADAGGDYGVPGAAFTEGNSDEYQDENTDNEYPDNLTEEGNVRDDVELSDGENPDEEYPDGGDADGESLDGESPDGEEAELPELFADSETEIYSAFGEVLYTFTPDHTGVYRLVSMAGEEIDPYVALYAARDSAENEAWDDNGQGDLNFSLEYEMEEGVTWYIGFGAAAEGEFGYTVALTEVFPEEQAEEIPVLQAGMEYEISSEQGEALYAFLPEHAGVYRITSAADEAFDPYVTLYADSERQEVLAGDDNGQGDSNFSLEYELTEETPCYYGFGVQEDGPFSYTVTLEEVSDLEGDGEETVGTDADSEEDGEQADEPSAQASDGETESSSEAGKSQPASGTDAKDKDKKSAVTGEPSVRETLTEEKEPEKKTSQGVMYAAGYGDYTLKVSGTFDYGKAQEVLPLMNALRKEQSAPTLVMDKELMDAAMQRAAEIAVDFDHTRPDGSDCYTVCGKMSGENIAAGNSTAQATYNQWYNSPGHYSNMINSSFKSVGIGCFTHNGTAYWVQCFSRYDADVKDSRNGTKNVVASVSILQGDYPIEFNLNMYYDGTPIELTIGENYQLTAGRTNPGWTWVHCEFTADSFTWKSSNAAVAAVNSSGMVTVKSAGRTRITAQPKTGSIAGTVDVYGLFSDVPLTHSFQNAIYWAAAQGITAGYSDGRFGVNDTVTRGQVMTFLWRAAGKPAPKKSTQTFKDVPTSHPFYRAIQWGSEHGITAGYSNGNFGVNDFCTRGQIVTFMWRYAGKAKPKGTKQTFSDVPTTHAFYKAVQWAYENSVTTGYSNGKFGVNDSCTRGQCVTFLYRVLR